MLLLMILTCLIFAKQNAVILILCRNSDLADISKTLIQFEEKINKFNYPYVFLNDDEWTDEFKNEMQIITKNKSKFGEIDEEDWKMPDSIDRNKALLAWADMKKKKVPYADKESYHNMCRFYSRTFYKHPLLQEYKYYWRIEPEVSFHCEIDKDPFDFMEENNKVYGFTIIMHEFMESIKTLEKVTNDFKQANINIIPKYNNKLNFIYNPNGSYNGCHFWSNFEIASFDFFRSELYNKYVDYLEEMEGFYYERWGDAPVHTLAVANFLDKSMVHFFDNIGYTHPPFTHCPSNGNKCNCKPESNFDFKPGSCLQAYLNDIKNLKQNINNQQPNNLLLPALQQSQRINNDTQDFNNKPLIKQSENLPMTLEETK